jgi:hypothetical protein
VNSFEQSHVGNCIYYDRIADWLEYSYLEKFLGNSKAIFTLFVNKDQRGNWNMFLLYPPCEETHEQTKDFRRMGHFGLG